MKSDWFKNLARTLAPEVEWEDEPLNVAVGFLMAASTALGGDTIEGPEETLRDYAVLRARMAIDRRMVAYARAFKMLRVEHPSYVSEDEEQTENFPEFITIGKYAPKLDINRATLQELIALPGIGATTGARIVELRKNGPFTDIEEVREAKNINFNAFKDRVYAGGAKENLILHSDTVKKFVQEPTFAHYLEVAYALRGGFELSFNGQAEEILAFILKELEAVAVDVEAHWSDLGLGFPGEEPDGTPFAVVAQYRTAELLKESVGGFGSLLFDSQYHSFLEDLIAQAKNSIRLIMFFFRLPEDEDYPTRPLFDALVQAHKRGVKVRVILDRDKVDEPYGSRYVNASALEALKEAGIESRFDSEDSLTHSKLLVVDDAHIVIGSHNWTAGSFYAYDDTSAYVYSEAVGNFYGADFDARWELLSQLNQ